VLAEYAIFFVLGLLVLILAPRKLDAVTLAVGQRPVRTVLIGLLATICLPVVFILLCVTIIGIPLALVVEPLAVLVAGIMGFTAIALYLGRALPIATERGGQVLRLAIGTALIVAVGQIPVLGAMAWVAAWLVAFGAVVATRFGQAPAVLDTTAAPQAPPPAAPPAQRAARRRALHEQRPAVGGRAGGPGGDGLQAALPVVGEVGDHLQDLRVGHDQLVEGGAR
jgi:hypothetical protein